MSALVQHVRAKELDEQFIGLEVLVCEADLPPVYGRLSDVARYLEDDFRNQLVVAPTPPAAGGWPVREVEAPAATNVVDVFVAGRYLRLAHDYPVLVEVTPSAAEPAHTPTR